jgi:hypothetical protein
MIKKKDEKNLAFDFIVEIIYQLHWVGVTEQFVVGNAISKNVHGD